MPRTDGVSCGPVTFLKDNKKPILYLTLHNSDKTLKQLVFPIDLSVLMKDNQKAYSLPHSSLRGQYPWTAGVSCGPVTHVSLLYSLLELLLSWNCLPKIFVCLAGRTLHSENSKSTNEAGKRLRVMNYPDGPLGLFSTFAYRRSSHRCESAAWHKFGLVWLYRSSLSQWGWGGGILLVHMI
jgi:hypothetical protein